MKEWKPLVEWFCERCVSKNIRDIHHIQDFLGGTRKDVGQPCFVIIFCEILKKLF